MRAGNVIGGGDFASDRLMTDLIKHFQNKGKKQKLIIRNPNSIRPWQYVLDVVNGYVNLAEKLYNNKKFVGSFNFGPNNNLTKIEVKQIVKEFQKYYNKKGNIIFKLNITNNKEEEKILLATKKIKKFLMFKNKINSFRNLIERSIFVYNQIDKKNIKYRKKIYLDEIKKYNDE